MHRLYRVLHAAGPRAHVRDLDAEDDGLAAGPDRGDARARRDARVDVAPRPARRQRPGVRDARRAGRRRRRRCATSRPRRRTRCASAPSRSRARSTSDGSPMRCGGDGSHKLDTHVPTTLGDVMDTGDRLTWTQRRELERELWLDDHLRALAEVQPEDLDDPELLRAIETAPARWPRRSPSCARCAATSWRWSARSWRSAASSKRSASRRASRLRPRRTSRATAGGRRSPRRSRARLAARRRRFAVASRVLLPLAPPAACGDCAVVHAARRRGAGRDRGVRRARSALRRRDDDQLRHVHPRRRRDATRRSRRRGRRAAGRRGRRTAPATRGRRGGPCGRRARSRRGRARRT